MDDETKSKVAPAPDSSGILFVEVPSEGFMPEQIKRYVQAGYVVWGTVKMVSGRQSTGLILPTGVEMVATDHLVLRLDVNHIPINLLAHHIIKARNDKGGLNQLSLTFFDLTLGELERGLQKAKANSNGQR